MQEPSECDCVVSGRLRRYGKLFLGWIHAQFFGWRDQMHCIWTSGCGKLWDECIEPREACRMACSCLHCCFGKLLKGASGARCAMHLEELPGGLECFSAILTILLTIYSAANGTRVLGWCSREESARVRPTQATNVTMNMECWLVPQK